MPKKMVMINTVCNGSHGRIMSTLQSALARQGVEAYAAYARGAENGSGRCIRIGASRDVTLHGVKSRLLDRQGFGSKQATRDFVRTLEKLQPDMIHLHNLHGYYLHLETLFEYLRASAVPVLWTLHDCWAFTGHCSHYVRASCQRWKTRCGPCPLKHEYPSSLLLDQSRRNYEDKRRIFTGLPNLAVITPSQWLAAQVKDSFLSAYPLKVIPNGVDLNCFSPPPIREERQDKPLVLAVAAPFDARKGFADTLAVAAALPQYRFLLVGLSERQCKALPQGVEGKTRTERVEELVRYYQQASALINTTYEDTYPTVNMEAMACGTPVAAYATGGCPEQIPPACGTLSPTGDVQQLIRALRRVVEAGRGVYAGPCRNHALEHFDREKSLAQYLDLYHSLVSF